MLNFKLTQSLAKLVMVGARLVSNSLIILGDAAADIQLVTFLLSNISELSIWRKLKNFDNYHL